MPVVQIPAQEGGLAVTITQRARGKMPVASLSALSVICHCLCAGCPAAPRGCPEGPAAGQAACRDADEAQTGCT